MLNPLINNYKIQCYKSLINILATSSMINRIVD